MMAFARFDPEALSQLTGGSQSPCPERDQCLFNARLCTFFSLQCEEARGTPCYLGATAVVD